MTENNKEQSPTSDFETQKFLKSVSDVRNQLLIDFRVFSSLGLGRRYFQFVESSVDLELLRMSINEERRNSSVKVRRMEEQALDWCAGEVEGVSLRTFSDDKGDQDFRETLADGLRMVVASYYTHRGKVGRQKEKVNGALRDLALGIVDKKPSEAYGDLG